MGDEQDKRKAMADTARGLCPFCGSSLVKPWARNAAAQCHICGEFWMTMNAFRFAYSKRLELAPRHLAGIRDRGRGTQAKPIHREDLEEALRPEARRSE
jgi:hypothetical protein